MKTKFSELLKVKKQKVSELENQLATKRQEKKIVLNEISALISKISELQLPQYGNFAQLKVSQHERTYFFREKENKDNMVKYFDQEINNLNYLYKEANIDYEKIKHLHDIEEKKIIENLEKQESKAMDEIANQLFLLRQNKEHV